MSLSLGIDIGTSGVRTAVTDGPSNVVSVARINHEEQNPERIDATAWWRAVKRCVVAQVAKVKSMGVDPAEIATIAVDGTSGTLVLTDIDLEPVTRALMYNSKGFVREAASIARFAPDSHITRGSGSALARAMRLFMEDTDKMARHLLHQADYITGKLLGHGGQSDHNNALKTGFDPEGGDWPDWIDDTGFCSDLLPTVFPVGTPLGIISKRSALELGLPPTTAVHAGTTDSIAAFLAAASLRNGTAVTSLGTTLAVKILSPVRIDDPAIGLYSHRLGDSWLVGGASNTGGGVLEHFFSTDQLQSLSRKITPETPTGLDFYPLIKPGERFPINDPDFPPNLSPRPAEDSRFLQALLEGMARIEARAYRAIAERGGMFPISLLTAGGGTSNSAWTKIREGLLGLRIQKAEFTEAAIGTARIPGAFSQVEVK